MSFCSNRTRPFSKRNCRAVPRSEQRTQDLARSAWDHVRVIEAHVLGASLHRGKEALQSCPRESDIAAQATQPFPLRRPAAPFEGPAL